MSMIVVELISTFGLMIFMTALDASRVVVLQNITSPKDFIIVRAAKRATVQNVSKKKNRDKKTTKKTNIEGADNVKLKMGIYYVNTAQNY
jgi:hypothetical protein